MEHKVIGLDLAKQVFHLVDQHGKRVKLKRQQLLAYFAQLPPGTVAMEACGGAHYWGQQLQKRGHTVLLLPPQHVKAYRRGQKNDFNDALAIQEAALQGRIRAVPVKTVAQQDQQSVGLIRAELISERTRLANQLRALLSERGLVLPVGLAVLRRQLPVLLEEADNALGGHIRVLLQRQYERLVRLDEDLAFYDRLLKAQVAEDAVCQRLMALPGFGPVISSQLHSWLGNGHQFKRGRDVSAALGLVPRQYTTGGKIVLLGISKKGNSYLRGLLIHGARAAAVAAKGKADGLSRWIQRLIADRGFNKAIVALANKLARIAWVVVARGVSYEARA